MPVLRLTAESLSESTCEAIEKGHCRNLESIHLTHLREEEEVQVCTKFSFSTPWFCCSISQTKQRLLLCFCLFPLQGLNFVPRSRRPYSAAQTFQNEAAADDSVCPFCLGSGCQLQCTASLLSKQCTRLACALYGDN